MIGRVVLVSLLALSACKKKDSDPETGTTGTGTTATGTAATGTADTSNPRSPAAADTPTKKPSGDTQVEKQTGPGFTVEAPGPATTEKVPAHGSDRAFERFTFYKSPTELYVVEITDLAESDDVGMVVNQMRMRITSQTQSVRNEEWIEGEVNGRDIRYVVDQGDDTLHARSKLLPKGHKIYQVRGVSPEDATHEAAAEKFVDSFAFTP